MDVVFRTRSRMDGQYLGHPFGFVSCLEIPKSSAGGYSIDDPLHGPGMYTRYPGFLASILPANPSLLPIS